MRAWRSAKRALWALGAFWFIGALFFFARPRGETPAAPSPAVSVEASAGTPFNILAAAATTGNAEIIAGGDPRLARLESVRALFEEAMDLIRAGADLNALCSARRCGPGTDAGLCHLLASLNSAERAQCRAFLSDHASELGALGGESRSPFLLSAVPLTVSDGKTLRTVAAVTERRPTSAIILHYPTIAELPTPALLALLTHELGHKLRWEGAYIDDTRAVGAFGSGARFLDSLGAAIGLYAPAHGRPLQSPPPLPDTVSLTGTCPLAANYIDRVLLGWSLDTEARLLPQAALRDEHAHWQQLTAASDRESGFHTLVREKLASEAVRRETIQRFFRKFLLRSATPAEANLFLGRLAAGDSQELVMASIVGDREYAATHASLNNQDFAFSVYLDLVGQPPDPAQLTDATRALQAMDKASWVLIFLQENPQVRKNRVRAWFLSYFNRPPSAPEEAEWAGHLERGESGELVQARLLAQPEYLALQQQRWKECRVSLH